MESLFNQNLLSLRNPLKPQTFSEALFGRPTWVQKVSLPKKVTPTVSTEVFTEKAQVIESLERFAHEKARDLDSDVLQVEGGEIHIKNPAVWDNVGGYADLNEIKSSFNLEDELLSITFKNKNPGQVKAIFVSEKYRPYSDSKEELRGSFIDELIIGFPVKTAELFERMILAMKFSPEEVIILPVEGHAENDLSKEVMEVTAFFKPEVLITLGAKATHKILKSNDRLSLVHGQFFNRKLGEEQTIQVVPLFHPSIIETNQNMKKTAWIDMQKIMKYLKKLP